MAYRGKYKVKKPEKYEGDFKNVVYRSLWERQFFRWCEDNSDVLKWSSESVIIPYICKTDGKPHRYFMDVKVKFRNGKTYLIEIKPEIQTQPPKQPSRKSKKYLKEVMTYVKINLSGIKQKNIVRSAAGSLKSSQKRHLNLSEYGC